MLYQTYWAKGSDWGKLSSWWNTCFFCAFIWMPQHALLRHESARIDKPQSESSAWSVTRLHVRLKTKECWFQVGSSFLVWMWQIWPFCLWSSLNLSYLMMVYWVCGNISNIGWTSSLKHMEPMLRAHYYTCIISNRRVLPNRSTHHVRKRTPSQGSKDPPNVFQRKMHLFHETSGKPAIELQDKHMFCQRSNLRSLVSSIFWVLVSQNGACSYLEITLWHYSYPSLQWPFYTKVILCNVSENHCHYKYECI